jgi:hypothetical protein
MRLGKRVLGEKAWTQAQAKREEDKKRAFVLGPRVTGKRGGGTAEPQKVVAPKAKRPEADETPTPKAPVEPTPTDAKPPAPPKHTLSIKELKAALEANPSTSFFDELFESELERPEGEPRKGALKVLLAAEQAREESRAAVVQELEAALKAE